MIKAAFFDIDRTLLSHVTNSVPDSARKALEQLTVDMEEFPED